MDVQGLRKRLFTKAVAAVVAILLIIAGVIGIVLRSSANSAADSYKKDAAAYNKTLNQKLTAVDARYKDTLAQGKAAGVVADYKGDTYGQIVEDTYGKYFTEYAKTYQAERAHQPKLKDVPLGSSLSSSYKALQPKATSLANLDNKRIRYAQATAYYNSHYLRVSQGIAQLNKLGNGVAGSDLLSVITAGTISDLDAATKAQFIDSYKNSNALVESYKKVLIAIPTDGLYNKDRANVIKVANNFERNHNQLADALNKNDNDAFKKLLAVGDNKKDLNTYVDFTTQSNIYLENLRSVKQLAATESVYDRAIKNL